MKSLVCLIFFLPILSHAEWTTEKPLKATLVSFDRDCATFRTQDKQIVHLNRKSLDGVSLISGKTIIDFYKSSQPANDCQPSGKNN